MLWGIVALCVIAGGLFVLFLIVKTKAGSNMMNNHPIDREPSLPPVITVIGIGGGGSNAVDRLLESGISGVNLIACNTDREALSRSDAERKIALGDEETFGRGASGKPENGRDAAEESYAELENSFAGSDMVVILAGMGGGNGTGASPVVAEIARSTGALTVAIVTTPFIFEGKRQQVAKKGLVQLRAAVDAITIILNERLMAVVPKSTSMLEAFRYADEVIIGQFIRAIISYCMTKNNPKHAFEDIIRVFAYTGEMFIGAGEGAGQHRVDDAAHAATANPLLDRPLSGATQALISIIGPPGLHDNEVRETERIIAAATCMDNPLTYTSVRRDESLGDQIRVSVIATGFAEVTDNVETGNEEDLELPNFLRHQ